MYIGVDLGGTKIALVALDEENNTLWQSRTATPQGNYQQTLESIRQLVATAEKETGQQGSVGIGIPGSPSPTTGLIRNANSTCLNGQPLQNDLETLLQHPVRIANDADCFTLSNCR